MSTENQPILDVRNLRVSYKGMFETVCAVDDISFSVYPGEALALVGESGSGKSTAMLAVMGLLPKRRVEISGEIRIFGKVPGKDIAWRDVRGKQAGVVFQDPMSSLNPYLTVGAQTIEPLLRHESISTKEKYSLACSLLEEMEIPEADQAFSRYPHQYSGGMRQRVMIASALSTQPPLIIADEPTTALDVMTQDGVLRKLRGAALERGAALLLITHDLGVVAGCCDRAAVMKDGKIVEHASIDKLYSKPSSEYTKRLLHAVPRLDVRNLELPVPKRKESPQSVLAINDMSVHFHTGKGGLFHRNKRTLKAVDEVSFAIQRGEVFALVGRSGSGKSTLMRAVAGLQKLTAGRVIFDGDTIDFGNRKTVFDLRRRVQMIFQDPLSSLNPRFTVEQIIAEPLVNFGVASRKEALGKARELMKLVQLNPDHANRYPHEFSGGQCQRIGVARALAVKPDLLLCDEPVSALDVSIQADVLRLLADLRLKLGLSMLFISHDLAVVRQLADRVAVMDNGKIVELESSENLYTNPEHTYTKRLMKAVPIPDPNVYRI